VTSFGNLTIVEALPITGASPSSFEQAVDLANAVLAAGTPHPVVIDCTGVTAESEFWTMFYGYMRGMLNRYNTTWQPNAYVTFRNLPWQQLQDLYVAMNVTVTAVTSPVDNQ
jgi:hypothetical protein